MPDLSRHAIRFEIPTVPRTMLRPKARSVCGHAAVYTPAKSAEDKQTFAALAAPYAPATPIDGPVSVRLVFRLPIPTSKPSWWHEAAAAGALYPVGSRTDLDNYEKLVLDALTRTGRWWRDDSQVVALESRKVYSAAPATVVVVEPIEQPRNAADWRVMRWEPEPPARISVVDTPSMFPEPPR